MDTRQTKIRWVTSLIVGLVIICLTMAIAIVQAEQQPLTDRGRGIGGPGREFGPGLFGLRLGDLSEPQREQVRAIMERHEDAARPLWEQHRAARTALEDAIVATPMDEGAIRQKSAELGSVDTELAVVRAHINAEVLTLLSPEQQKELQENRARMKERLENGPSRGRRGQ